MAVNSHANFNEGHSDIKNEDQPDIEIDDQDVLVDLKPSQRHKGSFPVK
jgi:hypothetical protein